MLIQYEKNMNEDMKLQKRMVCKQWDNVIGWHDVDFDFLMNYWYNEHIKFIK